MARRINSRLRITGTLVARTPLHVGGFGDSAETDLPLAQNGRGEWYMPGTSIAGMLRGWCRENFGQAQLPNGNKLIDEVFGFQDGDKGQASFVLVEDATIENVNDIDTEVRDSVGIDRFYGVAADRAKYDRAILPRGTRVNFEMTVEIGAQKKPDPKAKENNGESDHEFEVRVKNTKAVIGYLLDAMQSERLRLGGAKTRGFGRLRLEDVYTKDQSFIGFDILNTLNGDGGSVTIEQLKGSGNLSPNTPPRLEISIDWTPRQPVMAKAGHDGIGVDMLPLTSGVGEGKLALVLPGSSIKGVLRSHAERIMRTLLPNCDCAKAKGFHDQIDSIPLVEELFGAQNKSKDNYQNEGSTGGKKCRSNPKAKLGLGALSIDDCYTKAPMNADQWRRVEVARDDRRKGESQEQDGSNEVSYFKRELWRYLREIDENTKTTLSDEEYAKDTRQFKVEHHVAIDRWTGGAAEGALYSVLAPAKVEWEPMRLTLDFGRVEEGARRPVLMLLLLTLRDVAEGRLPFGFATNRGMGEIAVSEIDFSGNNLIEIGFAQEKGSFAELKGELKKSFSSEAWKEWLTNLKA
jgi:CRISPR/Cas system CSM-associated protein Csm3 (group 7 of RAMP superfamily)